jgi:hypothetical protein
MENMEFRESLVNSLKSAETWLVSQQKKNGSFVESYPYHIFEVWDTLNSIEALAGKPIFLEVIEKSWNFLKKNIRADGLCYFHSNVDTELKCTETSSLLHFLSFNQDWLIKDGYFNLLNSSVRPDGAVRLHNELHLVPEELQFYDSVAGFALLGIYRHPEINKIVDSQSIIKRAKHSLLYPENLTRHWQYFGSEYYAFYYLVRGLACHNQIDDNIKESVTNYIINHQREDGAILDDGPCEITEVSEQFRTLLALNTLQTLSFPKQDHVFQSATNFILNSQGSEGEISGGFFKGKKSENIYATSLWIKFLDWYLKA